MKILSLMVLGVCIIVAAAYPTFRQFPHEYKQRFSNPVQQNDIVDQNLLDRLNRLNLRNPQHQSRLPFLSRDFEIERQKRDLDEDLNAEVEENLSYDEADKPKRHKPRRKTIEIIIRLRNLLNQAIQASQEYEAEMQEGDNNVDVNSADIEKVTPRDHVNSAGEKKFDSDSYESAEPYYNKGGYYGE